MQDKKEEVMEILGKIELELGFLVNMMGCIGVGNFDPNPNDILGVSLLLDRIKKDIEKSMDVLSYSHD